MGGWAGESPYLGRKHPGDFAGEPWADIHTEEADKLG